MLKDLLNGTARIGLAHIEMHELSEVSAEIQVNLNYKDSLDYKFLPDRLRIEGTRELYFEPSCNFELTVTYFVEHFLKEPGSLDLIGFEKVKQEVELDTDFYLQNGQGVPLRISLLIGEITSAFGGAPVITAPIFPTKDASGADSIRMIPADEVK